MTNALTIIHWEHHSIESVLHAVSFFVDQMWAGKSAPENKVLRAMLQYIDMFPKHLHHPKEERHLFRRLRLRTHRADELLSLLEADHRVGVEKARSLLEAFQRYEECGLSSFYEFAIAFRDYARFYRAHMHCEEEMLLPLAESVLTDGDWREIDTAFAEQGDMHVSATGHDMGKLFDHIQSITPALTGVAPELVAAFQQPV
jgi:hemerythrin-like domain-containing protein